MNTFAVRGGKKVVTAMSPHVPWPPKSNVDEIDEIAYIRNGGLTAVNQQTMSSQFQGLFLDHLDNKARYSVITPGFIESVWALLTVLDLGKGDEVVCSPFADFALYETLERTGVSVVVHDCAEDTGMVTPEHIVRCVTDATKLVIVTHHRGNPVDVHALRKVVDKNPLIVEDCSYAHGAQYPGNPTKKAVGTAGDIAIFGLQYEKLIYTGQGAIMATNNRLVIDCIKQLFTSSYQSLQGAFPSNFGQKYYLSPLHAILGKYSLRQFLYTRRGADKCLEYFRQRVALVSYVSFVYGSFAETGQSSWYGFILQYDAEKLRNLPIQSLIALLQSEGVEVRDADETIIECLYDKGEAHDYNAAIISKKLLFLPSFYDRYEHKEVIDQYIAAFRKVQLNLFC